MPLAGGTLSVVNPNMTVRVDLRVGVGAPSGTIQLTIIDLDTGRSDTARIGLPITIEIVRWALSYDVVWSRLRREHIDDITIQEVLGKGDILVNLVS